MRKILFFILFLPLICIGQTPGCTDSTATNYDPNANTDDGSCIYQTNYTFQKRFGFQNVLGTGEHVKQINSNKFLVVSSYYPQPSIAFDSKIISYIDRQGNVLMSKKIDPPYYNNEQFYMGMVTTDISGNIYQTFVGQNSVIVSKTDSVGNQLWGKEYSFSGYPSVSELKILDNGNLLLCAESNWNSPLDDFLICKLNTNNGAEVFGEMLSLGYSSGLNPKVSEAENGEFIIASADNGSETFQIYILDSSLTIINRFGIQAPYSGSPLINSIFNAFSIVHFDSSLYLIAGNNNFGSYYILFDSM